MNAPVTFGALTLAAAPLCVVLAGQGQDPVDSSPATVDRRIAELEALLSQTQAQRAAHGANLEAEIQRAQDEIELARQRSAESFESELERLSEELERAQSLHEEAIERLQAEMEQRNEGIDGAQERLAEHMARLGELGIAIAADGDCDGCCQGRGCDSAAGACPSCHGGDGQGCSSSGCGSTESEGISALLSNPHLLAARGLLAGANHAALARAQTARAQELAAVPLLYGAFAAQQGRDPSVADLERRVAQLERLLRERSAQFDAGSPGFFGTVPVFPASPNAPSTPSAPDAPCAPSPACVPSTSAVQPAAPATVYWTDGRTLHSLPGESPSGYVYAPEGMSIEYPGPGAVTLEAPGSMVVYDAVTAPSFVTDWTPAAVPDSSELGQLTELVHELRAEVAGLRESLRELRQAIEGLPGSMR
jgi:hypothetical protein